MYILAVDSDVHEFNSYLDNEATLVVPNLFVFPNRSIAIKTIARFMLYYLRQRTIIALISSNKLLEKDVDDFLLHIPSEEISAILHTLSDKLSFYLMDNEALHFEGFVQFRLKEEKNHLHAMMLNVLLDYEKDNNPSSELAALENYLLSQTPKVDELFIVIDENQRIVLRTLDKIYLIEHANNEDLVLSHLIVLAPKSVKVYETYGHLSKETIIILQQLFKQKVVFSREKFFANQHRKN